MPPPTNISAATALDMGTTLPASITQNTSGLTGPDYEVWYKYTAQPGDAMIGIWAQTPSASNYFTYTIVYLGPTGAPVEYLFIEADRGPAQVPVTPGETYYFQVTDYQGDPPNADLTFSIVAGPIDAAPIGSILISDFSPGFPGAFVSAAAAFVLNFAPSIPSADFGDILPNGVMAFLDNSSSPPHVKVISAAFAQIADVAGLTNGQLFQQIRANGFDKFYVGANNNGGSTLVSTVDGTGAVGPDTWTLGANSQGLAAMAPSRDDTILYYEAVNGGSLAIHRWDLVNDVALSDLTAAVAGYTARKDILVMSDGSILVAYQDQSVPIDEFVKRYNAAGTLLNTYTFPTGETIDRIALNKNDNALSFWAWTFPSNEVCRFREIRISDGATISGPFDVTQFNNGISAQPFSDSMVRFGVSNSCPLIITRSVLPGGGGGGGDEVDEIIGPLLVIHMPREQFPGP